MKLRRNQRCPIHNSLFCCGQEKARTKRRSGCVSSALDHPHQPRGYRELRSPAEMKRLLDRKIVEQDRKCGLCKEIFTDYNDIVPDHIAGSSSEMQSRKRIKEDRQFKTPKSKASKAPVPMHPVLAGFLMAWKERSHYSTNQDYVFPSFRLKGRKPLSASIMVQKYLRPAAVKAGVIKQGDRVHFGFHNFRHSLASSLVKLKCDPKTVQSILRHEDVRTTLQLYAQSDQELKLDAQGKFLELLLGNKTYLLTEAIQ